MAVRCIPGVTPELIGNMWYLSGNAEVASFETGYSTSVQVLHIARIPCPRCAMPTAEQGFAQHKKSKTPQTVAGARGCMHALASRCL